MSDHNCCEWAIEKHKTHQSIIAIKSQFAQNPQHADIHGFTPSNVSPSDTEKIMQTLNTKKATGYDKLPAMVITLAAPVIATPLANKVNNSIQQFKFPTACKAAEVVPIHKKNDQLLRENHRPVSILTSLPKVIEISVNTPLTTFTNIILDDRISGYRKGYSCQYALLKFVEEW